jgi:uncharacterized ferredoxin-like protein
MIDGREHAREGMMTVASQVLQAYYKAPQTTSRVKLQSMVLSGEELQPMVDLVGTLEKNLGKEGASSVFFPIYMDYLCYKEAIESGNPPVVLVLGSDLTRSELGWNCGACGFPSCGEFNKFAKESGGMGLFGGGPSCAWKCIDFCIAVDYACAAANQMNIENRIQATFGAAAYLLGYLDNASMVLTLPLNPVVELWYYNRPSISKLSTYREWVHLMRQNYTLMFQMFSSNKHAPIKDDNDWWKKEHTERDTARIGQDPELEGSMLEARGLLMETAIELRQKVQEIKQKKGLAKESD